MILEPLLDCVNEEDQAVYIARSNNRSVVMISQERLDWLERAIRAKEESLEYAIARDQLIRRHVLPDDEIVESTDDYWRQFDK